MVMLTDRAKVALKSALARSIDEEGVGLRLDVAEEGGLALYPDQAKAGDQVIEHEGNVLLLIGDDLSQPLTGATIDLAETSEGTGLVIMKPQTSQDGRH